MGAQGLGGLKIDLSTQISADANARWFEENRAYVEKQERLECYRNIRRAIEPHLGVEDLLDVGNGGFFNYDTSLARTVVAVDLFLTDGPGPRPNTTFRQGSVLDLPCADRSFDTVIVQNVLHHVTGDTVAANHRNMRTCLREIGRVLRAGGTAVLVESTVNRAFYHFERIAFPLLRHATVAGHPMTFQFTARQIRAAAIAAGFRVRELTYVPRGRYVLQFGFQWPSVLTPARPIKLVLTKAM